MPQNYTGRLILIAIIIIGALLCIFPGQGTPNLKPGIDMVGGTSLLYEIKQPPGGYRGQKTLSEEVMESLKKRVDPQGVRNLIWRPQGNTRLEIQMPASKGSGESAAKRKEFAESQHKLEATNVRPPVVLDVVTKMTGDVRTKRLAELAMGSATRQKLFTALATTSDDIQKAAAAKDANLQAKKELEFETLKSQIEDSNLSATSLESLLSNKEQRQQKLDEAKKRFADFPERVAAIDRFDKALVAFNEVKGNLDDATDLKRLLQGSGVLEFHILIDDLTSSEARAMIERLQKRGPIIEANDTMRWYLVDRADEFKGLTQTYNDKAYALASVKPQDSMDNRPGRAPWSLDRAYLVNDPDKGREVGFQFDAQGAKYFGDLTGSHLPRGEYAYRLAIMLDDKLISSPNINGRIGGQGVISGGGAGGFDEKESSYLISTLNAGSLPAQLTEEPISEHTVGSTIGEDNLRRGLMSCVVGLVIVAVFMAIYYHLSGLIATVGVLLNFVLILGCMAAINATFTLPGVAALVLTIGMAVDANVLIFERLREEQARGLSLRMALRNAYDRASSAIWDGNLTTAITSLALYLLGSEEVKGFGLTLLIGIACSLFSALFVTKTLFALFMDKFNLSDLGSLPRSFPKWNKLLHPKFDWIKWSPAFYIFSGIFVIGGLTCFVVKLKHGEMLDIEFASGTSVQLELKQPMQIEDMRGIITKISNANPHALPSPSVVSVGTDGLIYEVVTPSNNAAQVKEAVLSALGDKLKIKLPSKFAGVDQSIDQAIGNTVIPITSSTQEIGGFVPNGLANYLGGAAIALKDLDPPLSPSDIHARIGEQRLQPHPGEATTPYREFTVVSPSGNDQPTATAVVLVVDPDVPHDKDETKWRVELAAPMWRLINEAIHSPAALQKVTNFDAAVAGETQRGALLALAISIIGIMIYIWVRFGNLKYGSATVVALLHDVLFTVAAIGFSHYLANTWLGNLLLIEPFRVNLTIVAAVLTVMGYSMNDTVVVFDRIRENRGKFGHLDRSVINNSINETLSRTLLTSGTTFVTVTTMYILGGSGVHGFTYALALGILVGTYSSIAIAAPILLIGTGKPSGGMKQSRQSVASAGKSNENTAAAPALVGRVRG